MRIGRNPLIIKEHLTTKLEPLKKAKSQPEMLTKVMELLKSKL
jgi:hypothetical protein